MCSKSPERDTAPDTRAGTSRIVLRFLKHFWACHPVSHTAVPCGPHEKGLKS